MKIVKLTFDSFYDFDAKSQNVHTQKIYLIKFLIHPDGKHLSNLLSS